MIVLSMFAASAAERARIDLTLSIPGILALLAGVLILFFPKLLNYLVAVYLILVGLVEVFNLRI